MNNLNVLLNDIQLIQDEVDNFITEAQKTKEGKILSYEYLRTIYLFSKIKNLQDQLNSKQDKLQTFTTTEAKDVLK